jgi:hypothetical protein
LNDGAAGIGNSAVDGAESLLRKSAWRDNSESSCNENCDNQQTGRERVGFQRGDLLGTEPRILLGVNFRVQAEKRKVTLNTA